jgi:hypothetical protein
VFADNQVARRWYAGLGMHEVSASAWWAVDPAAVVGALGATRESDAVVTDHPAATAVHSAYGFSQFRVVTPRGSHTVGRIGTDWFRLTAPGALTDPDLLALLARLDPGRRLLVVAPHGGALEALPGTAPGASPLVVAVRLHGDLDDVRARLAVPRMPPLPLPGQRAPGLSLLTPHDGLRRDGSDRQAAPRPAPLPAAGAPVRQRA